MDVVQGLADGDRIPRATTHKAWSRSATRITMVLRPGESGGAVVPDIDTGGGDDRVSWTARRIVTEGPFDLHGYTLEQNTQPSVTVTGPLAGADAGKRP